MKKRFPNFIPGTVRIDYISACISGVPLFMVDVLYAPQTSKIARLNRSWMPVSIHTYTTNRVYLVHVTSEVRQKNRNLSHTSVYYTRGTRGMYVQQ